MPHPTHASQRLQSLFLLSSEFASLVDVEELVEKMIDCLLQIFDAERGFILVRDEPGGALRPAIVRRIETTDRGSVSFTVAQRVARTRRPMLVTDVEAEARLRGVQSLARGDVRSIICAPLVHADDLVGVLYLDSPVRHNPFGEEDLALLGTFSAHAASAIVNALEKNRLRSDLTRLQALRRSQEAASGDFGGIVGSSPGLAAVVRQARAVASRDVTALVLGESGTGKELLAKAIHAASGRRDHPFVAVNCMALAREVIESELFGHEKGAFTGATERRIGRFEMADRGTIFLDEIGELGLDVQVKLLRVLQERQIERVGSARPIPIDVRLVAATNLDLEKAVTVGRFREDLYYRVNVVSLTLPPLRDRRGDVPRLVDHFVGHFNRHMGRSIDGVTPEAMQALTGYTWPGNVRELRNVVERAFVLETSDRITLESLPFGLVKAAGSPAQGSGGTAFSDFPPGLVAARNLFEKEFILEAVRRHHGNVSAAAAALDVPRNTLYRRMEVLGIRTVDLDRERAARDDPRDAGDRGLT